MQCCCRVSLRGISTDSTHLDDSERSSSLLDATGRCSLLQASPQDVLAISGVVRQCEHRAPHAEIMRCGLSEARVPRSPRMRRLEQTRECQGRPGHELHNHNHMGHCLPGSCTSLMHIPNTGLTDQRDRRGGTAISVGRVVWALPAAIASRERAILRTRGPSYKSCFHCPGASGPVLGPILNEQAAG